ncbi:MAG: glycosyltransferase family 39 protein [Anaerolineales bacterium]|nr:glycosyltransferase family 39 protein [Anaerolineales bacterium]
MAASNFKETSEVFSLLWPWFFFAAAFESLFAILALLLVPSESGISFARISLLSILVIFFFAGIYLGFIARRDLSRFNSIARTPFILSSALLSLTSSLLLFLLRYLNPERLLPYYDRVSPLLWYLLILGIQSAIFLLLVKNGFHKDEFLERKPVYLSALIAFCLLLSVLFFVSFTKLGITADTAYWGEPGVAILGWQFVLSILIGFSILIYQLRITSHQIHRFENIFLPLALYLTAAILWLSVPVDVLQNSFYAPISPPTNMPFPYSDAGFYDYSSQSILIGTSYFGGIPPRPLYVTFLAVLHFFFGQNYPAVIAAQTLVLALFPVTLYFLAKKLHSPAAGVTVALFAIFRELVGLWISSNTRVANSKIFTTDFSTAMGIALICLVAVWWLEKRDLKSTLVAGGAFGLLLLFRTQSLFMFPALFVLTWFAYQRKTKECIVAGVAFTGMMILTVLPWLIHNFTITGKFTFDDPSQMAVIYSQYSFTDNLDLSQFNPAEDSVGERLVSFSLENPAYVAGFMTSHFLNTEIGGLLALPLIKEFNGLLEPVNLYWVSWDGWLEWYNLILIIFYLAVLAVGFGASWRRLKWIALVPLAMNLGYAFANGIARFSSWRYNLPVDWVFYFYFAIGAIEILGGLSILFGAKHLESGSSPALRVLPSKQDKFNFKYILILFTFVFIGALPWLAKGFAEPRYTASQEQMISKLVSNGYQAEEINSFLSQENTILMEGRMLYPRLYRRNEGLSSANPWPAYAVKDYARIGFVLINDLHYNLIFPTRDLLDFPQGADAIVLACQGDNVLDVRVIDFGNQSFQSLPLSQPCIDD